MVLLKLYKAYLEKLCNSNYRPGELSSVLLKTAQSGTRHNHDCNLLEVD